MKRSFQDSIEPQDPSTGVGYVTAYSPPLPNNNYRDSKMGLLAQTTTFTTFVARQRSR